MFHGVLGIGLRKTQAFFVTYNWITYSTGAASEDMVLIYAFVELNISVETGTQQLLHYTVHDEWKTGTFRDIAARDKLWVNEKKCDVRNNTVEGDAWSREYRLAPLKLEAVTPLNDLLNRNIFASNFYCSELTVHSKCSTYNRVSSYDINENIPFEPKHQSMSLLTEYLWKGEIEKWRNKNISGGIFSTMVWNLASVWKTYHMGLQRGCTQG